MADKKIEVSANPMQVEFPRDKYQATQKLRSAGLAASARVGNDAEKLKVLIATLDVLKAHSIAAFKKRKEIVNQSQEAAKKRAEKEAALHEARRTAQIEQLEAQLAAVKGAEVEKEAE